MSNFPGYICSETFLSSADLQELLNRLDIDNKQDKQSHVYNRIQKVNVVNRHLRSSRKIEYRDPNLFDWAEEHIVKPLNAESGCRFMLVKNDLEVVKYSQGDLFRKHQDYVNFDSNEFRNYTFIVCLHACEEGGETILYDGEDQSVIEGTGRSPGCLLVFPKETLHEGAEIKKGSKVILKGNLICYGKEEIKDYVVVTLAKASKQTYILSEDQLKLQPLCLYTRFYEFEKRNHPDQHVFFMRDESITPLEFMKFYATLLTEEQKGQLDAKLDYIGVSPDVTAIKEFAQFLRSDEKIFSCSIRDYFQFLYANKDPNVLPFQMITLEAEKSSTIVWLGIYDNRFMTCDYYVDGVSADGYYESDEDDEEDGGHDDVISERRIQRCFKNNLSTLRLTYDANNIVPDHATDVIQRPDKQGRQMVREELYKRYPLQPMKETFNNIQGDLRDQVIQVINQIITQISIRSADDQGPDRIYEVRNGKTYSVLEDSLSAYTQKPTPLIPNMEKIREVGLESIISQIAKVDVASHLCRGSMSEFHCNETYYITFDLVCRFGFLKLT